MGQVYYGIRLYSRLLAGAFGANYRRRPHAKNAKAQRTPREEGGKERIINCEIIVNRMNLDVQR